MVCNQFSGLQLIVISIWTSSSKPFGVRLFEKQNRVSCVTLIFFLSHSLRNLWHISMLPIFEARRDPRFVFSLLYSWWWVPLGDLLHSRMIWSTLSSFILHTQIQSVGLNGQIGHCPLSAIHVATVLRFLVSPISCVCPWTVPRSTACLYQPICNLVTWNSHVRWDPHKFRIIIELLKVPVDLQALINPRMSFTCNLSWSHCHKCHLNCKDISGEDTR
jgi:hypothetical protein